MACRQFFTTCTRCGKQILMTQNLQNRLWIPCDPVIYRFRLANGPDLFVTPEGNEVKGVRDRDGQFGYRAHKRSCRA